jgi:hypothetical protein
MEQKAGPRGWLVHYHAALSHYEAGISIVLPCFELSL